MKAILILIPGNGQKSEDLIGATSTTIVSVPV
jgi:hypothetical protein